MYELIDNLGDGTEWFVRRHFINGSMREYPIESTQDLAIRSSGLYDSMKRDFLGHPILSTRTTKTLLYRVS